MRDKPLADARVGDWYCCCCLHDLVQIADKDYLQVVQADDEMSGMVWDSLEDAVADLAPDESAESLRSLLAFYSLPGNNPAIARAIAEYLKGQLYGA